MSVLIKGMEMPERCESCPFEDFGGCMFRVTRSECPLIEVPTPHGRLIDADERIKAINKKADTVSENKGRGATIPSIAWFSGMSSALSIIEAAPTIIEAEKGEGK